MKKSIYYAYWLFVWLFRSWQIY